MPPATRQVLEQYNELSIHVTFPGAPWDEQDIYVSR